MYFNSELTIFAEASFGSNLVELVELGKASTVKFTTMSGTSMRWVTTNVSNQRMILENWRPGLPPVTTSSSSKEEEHLRSLVAYVRRS